MISNEELIEMILDQQNLTLKMLKRIKPDANVEKALEEIRVAQASIAETIEQITADEDKEADADPA